uniref:Uncharacterized protein n=1 Tax=Sarcophilus harrisii TaxID=9305 RepID=A0A7N4PER9_SARHA
NYGMEYWGQGIIS